MDNVSISEQGTPAFAYYKAQVLQATDYSPFGAPLPGRKYDITDNMGVALNSTFTTNTESWASLNSATLTWDNTLQTNNYMLKVAGNASARAYKALTLIKGKNYILRFTLDKGNATTGINVPVYEHTNTTHVLGTNITASGTYEYRFTATDDAMNLMFEINIGNANSTYFYVDDISVKEEINNSYRFAFNGKEKDDETYGNGNEYDFGSRIYNPRLGRWFSIDPLIAKYPSISAFSYAVNNPLFYIDIDGRKIIIGHSEESQEYLKLKTALGVMKTIDPKKYEELEKSEIEFNISIGKIDKPNQIGETSYSLQKGEPFVTESKPREGGVEGEVDLNFFTFKDGEKENLTEQEANQKVQVVKNKVTIVVDLLKIESFTEAELKKQDPNVSNDDIGKNVNKVFTKTLGHELLGHGYFNTIAHKAVALFWKNIDKEDKGHGKGNPGGKDADKVETQVGEFLDKNKK